MSRSSKPLLSLLVVAASGCLSVTDPDSLPDGYWDGAEVRAILDKTLELRLDPDLSGLSDAEQQAVGRLLRVGEIFQELHEHTLHHQALLAHDRLVRLHGRRETRRTADLLDLYRLFKGPVATTLDNQREAFLPVEPPVPGRNVYPVGVTKEELEAALLKWPETRNDLLHLRAVVRRVERSNLDRDLAVLRRNPVLDTLHPGLHAELIALRSPASSREFYAVPYSVAFSEELLAAYGLLHEAADLLESGDRDFSDYLRLRARDLLADDYEAGDAAWVTGRFGNLNVQVGSYETYDDKLYGVKSFFSLSLLVRDRKASDDLRAAISGLQAIEDALPIDRHGKVREDIPVGVYSVIADFGQSRGTNTATILPNEGQITRKYGRTILLRHNIMTHPELFKLAGGSFQAALAEKHHGDLGVDGNFYRTLWHEIGHYLGPKEDRQGRSLDIALEENSDLIEEMKSDLVSLFAARHHHQSGYYDDQRLRSVYASGILRVLQKVKPRRAQPYQTMQLMQWNWFLEKGLLSFDADSGKLSIDYERYHDTVASMLAKVLDIQATGDKAASDAFIEQYAVWKPELHERVAEAIRARETYRYRLVRYAALGE